jgi:hypothetical protein
MDYSLLLGTHIVTKEEKERAKLIYKLRIRRQQPGKAEEEGLVLTQRGTPIDRISFLFVV